MGQDDNHWCELGFAEQAVVFEPFQRTLLPLREKVGGEAARMRGETPICPMSG